jgi:hypothetical protein
VSQLFSYKILNKEILQHRYKSQLSELSMMMMGDCENVSLCVCAHFNIFIKIASKWRVIYVAENDYDVYCVS